MSDSMPANPLTFQLLWDAMRAIDLPALIVTFSGGCDEGAVDDVSAEFGFDYKAEPDSCYARANARFDTCKVTLGDNSLLLADYVKEIAEGLLTDTDDVPDWYNNDGGNGTITFTLDGEVIEMEVNVRIVEFDTTRFQFDSAGKTLSRVPKANPNAKTPAQMLLELMGLKP